MEPLKQQKGKSCLSNHNPLFDYLLFSKLVSIVQQKFLTKLFTMGYFHYYFDEVISLNAIGKITFQNSNLILTK
jgi:hypothetical protein